jgi:hypothetical protein
LSILKLQRISSRRVTGDDIDKIKKRITNARTVSKVTVSIILSDVTAATICSNNELGLHCCIQDGRSTGFSRPVSKQGEVSGAKPL